MLKGYSKNIWDLIVSSEDLGKVLQWLQGEKETLIPRIQSYLVNEIRGHLLFEKNCQDQLKAYDQELELKKNNRLISPSEIPALKVSFRNLIDARKVKVHKIFLESIYNVLVKNQAKIEEYKFANDSVVIDLRAGSLGLSSLKIIIFDTNFLADLHTILSGSSKSYLTLEYEEVINILMFRKVLSELAHPSRASLAGGKIIHYLKSLEHYKVQDVDFTDPVNLIIRSIIIEVWRAFTDKGKKATGIEFEKFQNSADLEILTFILRNIKTNFQVFSSDNDIIQTVNAFKDKSILLWARNLVLSYEEKFPRHIVEVLEIIDSGYVMKTIEVISFKGKRFKVAA